MSQKLPGKSKEGKLLKFPSKKTNCLDGLAIDYMYVIHNDLIICCRNFLKANIENATEEQYSNFIKKIKEIVGDVEVEELISRGMKDNQIK